MSATATKGIGLWRPPQSSPTNRKIAMKSNSGTNSSTNKNVVIDNALTSEILDYLLQPNFGKEEFRYEDPKNELDFEITKKPDYHPRLTIYQDGTDYKTYKLPTFTGNEYRKELMTVLSSKLKDCVLHHLNPIDEDTKTYKLRRYKHLLHMPQRDSDIANNGIRVTKKIRVS